MRKTKNRILAGVLVALMVLTTVPVNALELGSSQDNYSGVYVEESSAETPETETTQEDSEYSGVYIEADETQEPTATPSDMPPNKNESSSVNDELGKDIESTEETKAVEKMRAGIDSVEPSEEAPITYGNFSRDDFYAVDLNKWFVYQEFNANYADLSSGPGAAQNYIDGVNGQTYTVGEENRVTVAGSRVVNSYKYDINLISNPDELGRGNNSVKVSLKNNARHVGWYVFDDATETWRPYTNTTGSNVWSGYYGWISYGNYYLDVCVGQNTSVFFYESEDVSRGYVTNFVNCTEYNDGSEAIANPGWVFSGWYEGNNLVSTNAHFWPDAVSGQVKTYVAKFTKVESSEYTYNAINGEVSLGYEDVPEGSSPAGSTAVGDNFIGWYNENNNRVSTNKTFIPIVPGTYTAVFSPSDYWLTVDYRYDDEYGNNEDAPVDLNNVNYAQELIPFGIYIVPITTEDDITGTINLGQIRVSGIGHKDHYEINGKALEINPEAQNFTITLADYDIVKGENTLITSIVAEDHIWVNFYMLIANNNAALNPSNPVGNPIIQNITDDSRFSHLRVMLSPANNSITITPTSTVANEMNEWEGWVSRNTRSDGTFVDSTTIYPKQAKTITLTYEQAININNNNRENDGIDEVSLYGTYRPKSVIMVGYNTNYADQEVRWPGVDANSILIGSNSTVMKYYYPTTYSGSGDALADQTFKIDDYTPETDGMIFVCWFDKSRPYSGSANNMNPQKDKPASLVTYETHMNHNFPIYYKNTGPQYSFDAIWAYIGTENTMVPYDGKPHSVGFESGSYIGVLAENEHDPRGRWSGDVRRLMNDAAITNIEYRDLNTEYNDLNAEWFSSFERTEPGTYHVRIRATVEITATVYGENRETAIQDAVVKHATVYRYTNATLVIYPTEANIVKNWNDDNDKFGLRPDVITDSQQNDSFDIIFSGNSLKGEYANEENAEMGITYEATEKSSWEAISDNAWKKTYSMLPVSADSEDMNIADNAVNHKEVLDNDYAYDANEINIPLGYTQTSKTVTKRNLSINEQIGSTTVSAYDIEIENSLAYLPVTFKKTAPDGSILNGAKFTIRYIETPDGEERDIIVEENMEIGSKEVLLPIGLYEITETAAPNGYLETDTFYLYVDTETGTVSLVNRDRTLSDATNVPIENTTVSIINPPKSFAIKFVKTIQGTDEAWDILKLNKNDTYNFQIKMVNTETGDTIQGTLTNKKELIVSNVPLGTYVVTEADDNYFDFVSMVGRIEMNGFMFDGRTLVVSDNIVNNSMYIIDVTNELEPICYYEGKAEKQNYIAGPESSISADTIVLATLAVYDKQTEEAAKAQIDSLIAEFKQSGTEDFYNFLLANEWFTSTSARLDALSEEEQTQFLTDNEDTIKKVYDYLRAQKI